MMVTWVCTKRTCDHREQQHAAALAVYHRAKNGDEHPMKREVRS